MDRSIFRYLLWSVCLFSLVSSTANANSITAYGVIITAMGSEGLDVQSTDKPSEGTSGEKLFTTSSDSVGKGGVLVMPNGSGGVTVMPYDGVACPAPSTNPVATGATGNTDSPSGSENVDQGTIDESPPKLPEDPVIQTLEPPGLETPPAGSLVDIPLDDLPTPEVQNPKETPEPASLILAALASVGSFGLVRRREKRS